jgi:hypothetical protein
MTVRPDISDKLVHFTSGETYDEAFSRIKSIISTGYLIAGNSKIKGGYKCVCFSEAPLVSIKGGLVNENAYSRYSPFGLLFDKKWIFAIGGRPVIYQPDSEYYKLPESIRWRHVRYEPNREETIDFTWEREWRIQCEHLKISPSVASIVLPNARWADNLIDEHREKENFEVFQYKMIMDEDIAEQYRESFKWNIYLFQ